MDHRLSTGQLRLLIAGVHWPPETFLQRLIVGLLQAGVEVTVGSAHKPDSLKVKWVPTPTWDAPLPVRLPRLLGMAVKSVACGSGDVKVMAASVGSERRLWIRLQQWNRVLPYAGYRWDAIYFPWNSAGIGCLPIFDLQTPVVVSCRGTQVSVAPHNPERVAIRDGLRATFDKAAAVHCVSHATLRDASRWGLDPAKAAVIHPAVDATQFCPSPRSTKVTTRFRVVSVGTLTWVKGYEWALAAIRQLIDLGVDVLYEIVGDGPDRQRLLYTISDLNLQQHVKLLGKMPPDEVLQQVQTADAFLLTSLSEGISNAVLEAMSCGVAVVTSDCGGMREAVNDGVEGFVVPVRDVAATATALEKLARNPDLRPRMGAAGRQRVLREFTLDQQIGKWLQLLAHVQQTENVKCELAAGIRTA